MPFFSDCHHGPTCTFIPPRYETAPALGEGCAAVTNQKASSTAGGMLSFKRPKPATAMPTARNLSGFANHCNMVAWPDLCVSTSAVTHWPTRQSAAHVALLTPSFEAKLPVFAIWMSICGKSMSVERSPRLLSLSASQEAERPMSSPVTSTHTKSPAAKSSASCLRAIGDADIFFRGAATPDNVVRPLRLSGVGFGIRYLLSKERLPGYPRFD